MHKAVGGSDEAASLVVLRTLSEMCAALTELLLQLQLYASAFHAKVLLVDMVAGVHYVSTLPPPSSRRPPMCDVKQVKQCIVLVTNRRARRFSPL